MYTICSRIPGTWIGQKGSFASVPADLAAERAASPAGRERLDDVALLADRETLYGVLYLR